MTLANRIAFVVFCAAIVFTALAYGTVHQPIILLFYTLVATMFVLWMVDSAKTGVLRFSRDPVQLLIYAAAVYGFVQVIPFGSYAEIAGVAEISKTISLDPFITKMTAIHFLVLGVMFSVVLVLLDSASRIRRLALLIAVFSFGFAFFAILQGVLSPDRIFGVYEAPAGASPYGSFVNRHNFAAYMEMGIAIPLGLLFTGAVAADKRLLSITAVGLMGVSLLLSGSRGGLIAFVAQVIFLVILTVKTGRSSEIYLKSGLAVMLLAAVVGGSFFVGGESSLTRIADTAGSRDITTDRSHIWTVTMKVIGDNLPFGAGLGAFGVAYTKHDSYSGLERVEQAHNDYLQAVADAGLVGLILGGLFIWFIFQLGRRAVRTENRFRRGVGIGALSGVFAILVHSVFDFVLHTTAISVLFLTLVALLIASLSRYEDDIEDSSRPSRRGHKGARRSRAPSLPVA
ncbi:MAG TPA: O-antigen ligase family protein [Pyrinomonadaceae bacterium]|nr:O-antigen ligase family protein [Pyrinomonadaceae bacterium]HMP67076.1 O-antigen ligase family protein [Pyrinomonadaceae bacterium]